MRHLSTIPALVGVMAALIIGACTAHPVRDAQTFEQKSYALYGTYAIFQGKAAELATESTTPAAVKTALKAADQAAYPVVESLVDSAIEVGHIRETLVACKTSGGDKCEATTDQVLQNAITHLSELYLAAQPKVLALVAAVKGAK